MAKLCQCQVTLRTQRADRHTDLLWDYEFSSSDTLRQSKRFIATETKLITSSPFLFRRVLWRNLRVSKPVSEVITFTFNSCLSICVCVCLFECVCVCLPMSRQTHISPRLHQCTVPAVLEAHIFLPQHDST